MNEKTAGFGPAKRLARFAEKHPVLTAGALGAGGGLGVSHVAVNYALPGAKARRKQIKAEHRDPRLYANLKGMLTGKSRAERVAAHKNLSKGDGTILGAMRKGWSGGKEKKASLLGFFDELEKIAQGPGGGSLANRMRLGGTSSSAMDSIQGAVGGNVGPGPGGGAGGASEPPPPPPPPPAPAGGDIGGGGGGAPSGADLGIPGGGPPGGGGGGNPLGGAAKRPSASDLGIPGASPF